jgi:enoyl-CoA hydratase
MEDKPTLQHLEVTEDGPVIQVTINRPKALNALNEGVLTELDQVVDHATQTKKRVLTLEGQGGKAFVAGADISKMKDFSVDQALQFARLGQQLTTKIEQAPFISIAKVNGYALGGGCELAMACDLVIAADNAVFGQPEVDLGLIPGFGGTQRLVKRVGQPLAMAMLVGGRKLTGQEGFHCGLVSEVVTPNELDSRVSAMVQSILKASPQAVTETKRLAQQAFELPVANGLAAEATAFANCFAGKEAREGIQAFIEKRPANFSE